MECHWPCPLTAPHLVPYVGQAAEVLRGWLLQPLLILCSAICQTTSGVFERAENPTTTSLFLLTSRPYWSFVVRCYGLECLHTCFAECNRLDRGIEDSPRNFRFVIGLFVRLLNPINKKRRRHQYLYWIRYHFSTRMWLVFTTVLQQPKLHRTLNSLINPCLSVVSGLVRRESCLNWSIKAQRSIHYISMADNGDIPYPLDSSTGVGCDFWWWDFWLLLCSTLRNEGCCLNEDCFPNANVSWNHSSCPLGKYLCSSKFLHVVTKYTSICWVLNWHSLLKESLLRVLVGFYKKMLDE